MYTQAREDCGNDTEERQVGRKLVSNAQSTMMVVSGRKERQVTQNTQG